jgi:hypothetical protein
MVHLRRRAVPLFQQRTDFAARLGPGLHVNHIAPYKRCRSVHAGTLKPNSVAVEQRSNARDAGHNLEPPPGAKPGKADRGSVTRSSFVDWKAFGLVEGISKMQTCCGSQSRAPVVVPRRASGCSLNIFSLCKVRSHRF